MFAVVVVLPAMSSQDEEVPLSPPSLPLPLPLPLPSPSPSPPQVGGGAPPPALSAIAKAASASELLHAVPPLSLAVSAGAAGESARCCPIADLGWRGMGSLR